MALISCKDCGSEISTNAKSCPKCGAKVPKTKWWLWIPLGLVVAFLGFGLVAGNSPEAKEKAQERSVIDLCWEDQKRKSFSDGTQRFVARVCENLEDDFAKKHGHRP